MFEDGSAKMNIDKRFSSSAIVEMRRQIAEADGNEIFFVGSTNNDGVVVCVAACSRGNESSVPVNFSYAREASVLIHNHPSGKLCPSDADLAVASDAAEKAQGFYIINNDVSDVYVVVEPVKPDVTVSLDTDATAQFLSSDGEFAKMSLSFEERPPQLGLVKKVVECFNEDSVGVFEAGTGVGKSFAYLVPSMIWAALNRERVVISTGTINLQQQLMEKDIPLAEKIIGKKVKSVLVKGRQNYICLRRLADAANERDLFSAETEILDRILAWSKETKTGSKSDLSFMPPENVWQRVNSEADACLGMRCRHREHCFVLKVRKEASDAAILIVNHHILFADIESRMNGTGYEDTAILPPYKRIVFDEAHGIEDAATSFFSHCLNRFRVLKQLNLLYRQKKGAATGFLFTVCALSRTEDKSNLVENEIVDVKSIVQELENTTGAVLGTGLSLRLFSENCGMFAPIFECMKRLQQHIGALTGLLRDVIDGIDDEDRDNSSVYETRAVLRRLDDVAALCEHFFSWSEHTDKVFWVQAKKLSPVLAKNSDNPMYYEFNETPLDVAPMMNSGVFEPMRTVVCTSATIRINNTFDFWKKRVGISFVDKSRIKSGNFDSPFPYEKNVLFAVPSDAPFPDTEHFQSYVADSVVRLIEAAGGKSLILFTSYDSLRHTCETARARLRTSGITILKQGDDERFRLLSQFKEDRDSVLFATDSFWEGVDVPGDSLSQVIIVKLPFGVPGDPVFAARSELIAKRGGFPFMELSVPAAVIRFRQGFGRLIRRSDDRGVVVVMDRRIVEKSYGCIFTASIPRTKHMYRPISEIVERVKSFCE